jgi:hypothetical protein
MDSDQSGDAFKRIANKAQVTAFVGERLPIMHGVQELTDRSHCATQRPEEYLANVYLKG